MNKKYYLKELSLLQKKEDAFLKKYSDKKQSKFDDFLSEKIPDKFQTSLSNAFSKAFESVFIHGTDTIEKLYNKEEKELRYQVNSYALSQKTDKKRFRAFEKNSSTATKGNLLLSGVKGIGMGILGIGLPDIPIFATLLLKSCYEISLSYGFDYNDISERYLILSLIEASLSYGEDLVNSDLQVNRFIKSNHLPQNYNHLEHIKAVSNKLCDTMLYMKFVQGIAVVGLVGGLFDTAITNRVLHYVALKQKRRHLLNAYLGNSIQ